MADFDKLFAGVAIAGFVTIAAWPDAASWSRDSVIRYLIEERQCEKNRCISALPPVIYNTNKEKNSVAWQKIGTNEFGQIEDCSIIDGGNWSCKSHHFSMVNSESIPKVITLFDIKVVNVSRWRWRLANLGITNPVILTGTDD